MFRCLIVAFALSIGAGQCYMLLQVRKGDNQSNVDAVIHKVVKNQRDDAEESRKRFGNSQRFDTKNSRPRDRSGGLESVVLAINTGASPNQLESDGLGIMKKAQEFLLNFLKQDGVSSFFRANKDSYKVKPEIVHFRSGKPSLMLEVNFESIMTALKEALRSKTIRNYADTWAQKAAIVYRTVRDELQRGNSGIKDL